MNRTLVVLTLAACMAQTGAPIVVLLGGIIGAELAPSPGLATLPVALMILGTAASTIPASFIMRRFGRRKGFLFAASYAVVAGLLAAFAVQTAAFWLLCTATFLIGSHNAFVQQYRFAVAESVPAARLGRSLSVLMLAGVVAAYLGPKTATLLQDVVPSAVYAGSFLGLSVLMAGAGMVLSFYVPDSCDAEVDDRGGRSLWQIAQQLDFKIAIVASVAAWSIMSLLMTATPVAMHHLDQFSMIDTAWVIQSHIMAMFLPALVSGLLLDRVGPLRMITAGAGILIVCLGVAFAGRHLMHYWWALVLLGIGWNFMYLGGTALLTRTYEANERFKVQACNDFVVFAMQAVAALSSGFFLFSFGWSWLVYLSAGVLIVPLALVGYKQLALKGLKA